MLFANACKSLTQRDWVDDWVDMHCLRVSVLCRSPHGCILLGLHSGGVEPLGDWVRTHDGLCIYTVQRPRYLSTVSTRTTCALVTTCMCFGLESLLIVCNECHLHTVPRVQRFVYVPNTHDTSQSGVTGGV
jgi:hypothetical protein